MDEESQKDEIIVLQSIFDKNILEIDQTGNSPSGRFLVHPSLQDSFRVVYRDKDTDGKIIKEQFDVCYLPPLTLHFVLPEKYPSKCNPAFLLSCPWLTCFQLSKLCRRLDKIWEERQNDVILYDWMEFLKENALSHLGITNVLNIDAFGQSPKRHEKTYVSAVKSDNNFSQSNSSYYNPDRRDFLLRQYQRYNDKCFNNYRYGVRIHNGNNVERHKNSVENNNCYKTSTENYFSTDTKWNNNSNQKSSNNPTGKTNSRYISRTCNNTTEKKTDENDDNCDHNSISSYTNTVISNHYKNNRGHSRPLNSIPKTCNYKNNTRNVDCDRPSSNNGTSYNNFNNAKIQRTIKPHIYGGRGTLDQRATNELLENRSSLITVLKKYNEEMTKEEYNNQWFMCKVCFEEKRGKDFMHFPNCKHMYCHPCMKSFFEIQIRDGNVECLICPEEKCTSQALPSQVCSLVAPELYARYDSLLLSSALESMTDVIYCPRLHCQYPVILDPDRSMARCPSCAFVFCTYCKMTYHGVASCRFKTEERKRIREEYTKANKTTKLEMEQRFGRRTLHLLLEETFSEEWVESNCRKCPHCNSSIEKIEGCNKMTCWKCNTYFCWTCGKKLNIADPYIHYSDPKSPCYNQLFLGVDETDDDWEVGEFL